MRLRSLPFRASVADIEPKTTLPVVTMAGETGPQPMTDVMNRNVTGARHLASSFRDRLAAARQKIAGIDINLSNAMSELERTTESAESIVRDVERESAELQASLATLTNGHAD
jgi:exonuclease VII small subunit